MFTYKTTIMTREDYNKITEMIIGAAIEVHRELGPGLLETVYEHCLEEELLLRGLTVRRQVEVPIVYKGKKLDKVFFIDILVNGEVVLELKSVEQIQPVHEVQLVTYMKLSKKKLGLLLNFNVEVMRLGIRRKVNNF